MRIRGREATDAELLAAFNAVEDARVATAGHGGAPTPLTYFEFGTLAALWLFARAELDALVLEVGLGGRLDAVNVVDADGGGAHERRHRPHRLPGDDARGHRPRKGRHLPRRARRGLCRCAIHPQAWSRAPRKSAPRLLRIGRDYGFVNEGTQWKYWGPGGERFGLPFPALRGAYQLNNAATVLAVIDLLRDALPVRGGALREGLLTVELPGRFQVLPGRPTVVLDVAHNPHAAGVLADELGAMGFYPPDDRRVRHVRRQGHRRRRGGNESARRPLVRGVASRSARRRRRRDCATRLLASGVDASAVRVFPDIASAYAAARDNAGEADRIVVFGSFLTVAAVLAATKR